jgi:endonuclease/exonuclease/phosphatase family metal-dependent hydrolase
VRAFADNERASIDRWCAGVGPPARISGRQRGEVFTGSFAVVAWNTHVGAGDIDALVADLRSGRLTGGASVTDFVLLLQEVSRAGPEVPAARGARWAGAIGLPRPRIDVIDAAARHGLSLVYVPSMRNGPPDKTSEDRGNAILATLPLDALTAIELPLERQRRVAVQATVAIPAPDGGTVRVTLVSTHFTNMVLHHLWVLSESGRLRQARALGRALPSTGALIVGGDFNSWFGYRDAAYRQLAEQARRADVEDRRATFGPMRLDHVLFRLPPGWRTTLRRAESKYGSDHYPLVAVVATDG